jgi:carbon-monoxide dehydrogenase iron sulfur subunit
VPKRLTVVPERCSGCRLCEAVCALHHFGVNNPRKAAMRVIALYPHPVIRMPVVCRQCAQPKCRENCPTDAIVVENGTVKIMAEKCVQCQQCVISCPFGAIFVHDDVATPFKCDLCGGHPQCVRQCPKGALQYVPEHQLGQASRLAAVLRYAHMKEVEYVEKGERKKLRYAEIGREQSKETLP